MYHFLTNESKRVLFVKRSLAVQIFNCCWHVRLFSNPNNKSQLQQKHRIIRGNQLPFSNRVNKSIIISTESIDIIRLNPAIEFTMSTGSLWPCYALLIQRNKTVERWLTCSHLHQLSLYNSSHEQTLPRNPSTCWRTESQRPYKIEGRYRVGKHVFLQGQWTV